jgi:hypothetical protein
MKGDKKDVRHAIDRLTTMALSTKEVEAALGRRELTFLSQLADSEGAVVSRLLGKIRPTPRPPSADCVPIVRRIVAMDSYREMADAEERSTREWGQYVIPAYLESLREENPDYRIRSALLLTRVCRRVPIEPVAEAMLNSEDRVGTFIAKALALSGKEPALAALAEMSERSVGVASASYSMSFVQLAGKYPCTENSSAEMLYLRMARKLYNQRSLSMVKLPTAVWHWNRALEPEHVPRLVLSIRLAKNNLYACLRTNPENIEAKCLLVRSLASGFLIEECLRATKAVKGAPEDRACETPRRVSAFGWRVVTRALVDSIREEDFAVACLLLDTMPRLLPPMKLTRGLGLLESLESSSVAVRTTAIRICGVIGSRVEGVPARIEELAADENPCIASAAQEALLQMRN